MNIEICTDMQDPHAMQDRSIAGQIAATLADRIVAGEIAPDTPLRQDHIAEEFGASHVPVREAFRRLEARGLVVREPRRGVRVPPLDAAAILEVTEMRAALETLALRHAVPNQAPDSLTAAQQAIDQAEASDDIRVWEAANRRFHRAILQDCRMPRLLAVIDDLHAADARFLFAAWRQMNWQQRSEHEHRDILAALRVAAADRAADILRSHITAAGAALRAAVAET